MSDFTKEMASAIAAARPQMPTGGSRAPGGPAFRTMTKPPHYGELGHGLGTLGGAILGSYVRRKYMQAYDPETIRGAAVVDREQNLRLSDEERLSITLRPEVQKIRQRQYQHAPQLFVGADEEHGDESLRSHLEYARDVRGPGERVKRAEAKKPVKETQEFRKGEADIKHREAAGKLVGADAIIAEIRARVAGATETEAGQAILTQLDLLEERLRDFRARAPAEVKGIKATTEGRKVATLTAEQQLKELKDTSARRSTIITQEFEKLREEIKGLKTKRAADVLMAPKERAYIDAKTFEAKERAAAYKSSVLVDMETAKSKDMLKDQQETFNTWRTFHANLVDKYELKREFDPGSFAKEKMRLAQDLVNTLGERSLQVKTKAGQTAFLSVPATVMSTQGTYAVNNALNETYMAFLLLKDKKAPAADLRKLYTDAETLYNSTYQGLTQEALEHIPEQIKLMAPDVQRKLMWMKYQLEYVLSPPPPGADGKEMDEEELAAWKANGEQIRMIVGEPPRPDTKRSWLARGLNWIGELFSESEQPGSVGNLRSLPPYNPTGGQ